jgi:hypothetical protein
MLLLLIQIFFPGVEHLQRIDWRQTIGIQGLKLVN